MRRNHTPSVKIRFVSLLAISLSATSLMAGSGPACRAEKRAAAFAKLSCDDQKLVLGGQVRPGMSKDAVYIAWGEPDRRAENGNCKSASETWIYERQLTVNAPLGSYDQVYPSVGPCGPHFSADGFESLLSVGCSAPPRALITDERVKRAEFVDGCVRRCENRWVGQGM